MAVSTNVSALAIAGQLGAPFSLILAIIFLGERVHKYRIAGMALAFAGVVMIVFDPNAVNEHLGLGTDRSCQFHLGLLFVDSAAAGWGASAHHLCVGGAGWHSGAFAHCADRRAASHGLNSRSAIVQLGLGFCFLHLGPLLLAKGQ